MYAAGLNVVVNTLYVICGDPGWQPPSISPRAGHRGFAWLNSCKLEASGVSPRPSDFFFGNIPADLITVSTTTKPVPVFQTKMPAVIQVHFCDLCVSSIAPDRLPQSWSHDSLEEKLRIFGTQPN